VEQATVLGEAEEAGARGGAAAGAGGGAAASAGGGADPSAPPVITFGEASTHQDGYLTPKEIERLVAFCGRQLFQYYVMARTKLARLKAPKVEYWISENGERPVYYWKQGKEQGFYHAGWEMPPLLVEMANRQSDELGLEGDRRFNHCIIICNDQPGQYAPPHSDAHETSLFVDFSLGYTRTMEITRNVKKENKHRRNADKEKTGTLVKTLQLTSGSRTVIDATDNKAFEHSVLQAPGQPADEPRFSIVFRAIVRRQDTDACGEHFAPIDLTAAASVRPGGTNWHPYVPLLRRSDDSSDLSDSDSDDPEAETIPEAEPSPEAALQALLTGEPGGGRRGTAWLQWAPKTRAATAALLASDDSPGRWRGAEVRLQELCVHSLHAPSHAPALRLCCVCRNGRATRASHWGWVVSVGRLGRILGMV
jgi:hypothetical protein